VLTLGIETSCDETSAALFDDREGVRSNVISSQVELHAAYGGVVPELAARSHIERLPWVTEEALRAAGARIDDVDLVAVTRGPGLVGALLTGVGFARGLALERGLPIVGVSHIDGHIHSAFLERPDLRLPMLVLVVSGGHTEMVLIPEEGQYQVIGRTRDDAAGEAYDKVARMLGLGYPGGPEIDRLAGTAQLRQALTDFPLPQIRVDGLDFSFSGIKTAVRYALERHLGLPQGSAISAGDAAGLPADLVASAAGAFQSRVVEHLVSQFQQAALRYRPSVSTLAVAGGVAMNSWLRQSAAQMAASVMGSEEALVIPSAELCTDNAAMIAIAGARLFQIGLGANLTVDPGLRLSSA
jgi:N6-L-threonylcarbamoyladenine synthase